jgi:hypothetical protein
MLRSVVVSKGGAVSIVPGDYADRSLFWVWVIDISHTPGTFYAGSPFRTKSTGHDYGDRTPTGIMTCHVCSARICSSSVLTERRPPCHVCELASVRRMTECRRQSRHVMYVQLTSVRRQCFGVVNCPKYRTGLMLHGSLVPTRTH